MREVRRFAQRSSAVENIEPRRKYFLLYEGEETEKIYFQAINSHRENLKINPLIELIPMIRSYSEHGWSNPKKLLDRLIENLEEYKSGIVTYRRLLDWITDYLEDHKGITKRNQVMHTVWETMYQTCVDELGVSLNSEVADITDACSKLLEMLESKTGLKQMIDAIPDIIKSCNITYEEGFDKICFIIDRDKNSFIASNDPQKDQYGYVISRCREYGLGLYISNPCFEFWLLLHFDDVHNLDEELMLENARGAGDRTYTEDQLRKIMGRYRKSRFDTEVLIANVDKAILNEKSYCEDEEELESKIGSRIGILIEEMRT